MGRRPDPLTEAEITALVTLWRGGLSLNQISKRLRRRKGTLCAALRAAGIDARKIREQRTRERDYEIIARLEAGETQAAIAADFGITPEATYYAVRRALPAYLELFPDPPSGPSQ